MDAIGADQVRQSLIDADEDGFVMPFKLSDHTTVPGRIHTPITTPASSAGPSTHIDLKVKNEGSEWQKVEKKFEHRSFQRATFCQNLVGEAAMKNLL